MNQSSHVALAAVCTLLTASSAFAQPTLNRMRGDTLRFWSTFQTHMVTRNGGAAPTEFTNSDDRRSRVLLGGGDTLTIWLDSLAGTTVTNGVTTVSRPLPDSQLAKKVFVLLPQSGVVTRLGSPPPSSDKEDLMGIAFALPKVLLRKGTVWADTTNEPSPRRNQRIIRYEVVGDSVIAQHQVSVIAVTGSASMASSNGSTTMSLTGSYEGRTYYSSDLAMVLKSWFTATYAMTQGEPGSAPSLTQQVVESKSLTLIR